MMCFSPRRFAPFAFVFLGLFFWVASAPADRVAQLPTVGPVAGSLPAVVSYQPSNRPDPPSFSASPDPPASPHDHDLDIRAKLETDSIYEAHAEGSFSFRKIYYPSGPGDMHIPAYLFQPLGENSRGPSPALVWVHGGVHSDWSATYLPFVKEAISRGYVVIAPDYRGSTGYGIHYYQAIDYGGYEVDDVVAAVDYLRERVPDVDPQRVGIMGWSHGGFIATHAIFRDEHPFRAAVAIAPVTNLIFRLAYKGPAYQALFTSQQRIAALPHERPDIYIERSPIYHVDGLDVPLMVHVATNDTDVDFVESQMLIHALQARKPELSEIKIYEDPPGGHIFSRLVDINYQAIETAAMVDSWNRTWSFFERHLAPTDDDSSQPAPGSTYR
jgi:dipeptidyl aminopeptidase/acylaminoacyl peptidase